MVFKRIEAMKAKYGNQIVDVWEIGQATPKPSWVEEAFQKKLYGLVG